MLQNIKFCPLPDDTYDKAFYLKHLGALVYSISVLNVDSDPIQAFLASIYTAKHSENGLNLSVPTAATKH